MEYNVIKEGLLKVEREHIKRLVEFEKKYNKEEATDIFIDNIYNEIAGLSITEFSLLLSKCEKDKDISRGILLALMVCVSKVGKKA